MRWKRAAVAITAATSVGMVAGIATPAGAACDERAMTTMRLRYRAMGATHEPGSHVTVRALVVRDVGRGAAAAPAADVQDGASRTQPVVEGATVAVALRRDGEIVRIANGVTGEDGIARLALQIPPAAAGSLAAVGMAWKDTADGCVLEISNEVAKRRFVEVRRG